MSSQASPSAPPKPTLPPFWKWLMRITFAVTMVLFLAPAVYVVKYYAMDRPREEALTRRVVFPAFHGPHHNPDEMLQESRSATDSHLPAPSRVQAIRYLGDTLLVAGLNYKRPIECLMAKATLAGLAAKDPDPTVKAAAAEELEKVARRGAVLQR